MRALALQTRLDGTGLQLILCRSQNFSGHVRALRSVDMA